MACRRLPGGNGLYAELWPNKELRVTKTATRADEKLDLISLDEYLKKLNMTISPNDPEKPDDGGEEGGGNEGGGSGEAPDPAA